jgi:hypothetical protein
MRTAAVLCLCVATVSVGCGNSDSDKPVDNSAGVVDPTTPENVVPADLLIEAIANANAERLVMLSVGSDTGCQYSIIANCVMTTCSKTDAGSAPPTIDQGVVTITSAALGPGPLTVAGLIDQQGDWPAGDSIRFQGSGGTDLPAFDFSTTMAATVTLLAFDGCADETGNAPCVLSASGSIVTWAGGGNGNISVTLSPRLDTGADKTYARCTYPASAGKGRFPAAALAALPASTGYSARSSTFVDPPKIVQGTTYRASVSAARILIGKPIALQTPPGK